MAADTSRRVLTDRFVQAAKPPETGRKLYYDAMVPGLAVMVTDRGARSWVLYTRYPDTGKPARRALGTIGALSLVEAREKARGWLAMIERGSDPADEERRQAAAAQDRRETTFGAIAERYFATRLRRQRRGAATEREMRTELLSRWADRPIAEITSADVRGVVRDIAGRGATYQAHNVLGHAKTFYNWVVEEEIGGLAASPCDRIRPAKMIGPKRARQRVLSDDELFALWRAAGRLGYPFGPAFRMLVLTGQRKTEVSDARWREFDTAKRVWTVPPERFKSDATHIVPIGDDAAALLDALPRFRGGDFLFSTDRQGVEYGARPVDGFSKAKRRLDRRMLRSLRAMTRARGGDPTNVELPPFVIHDIRRTVRTRLSELRVPERVAELVIGHARRGLVGTYDRHQYLEEMREALDTWAVRLRSLVERQTNNVVQLAERSRVRQ